MINCPHYLQNNNGFNCKLLDDNTDNYSTFYDKSICNQCQNLWENLQPPTGLTSLHYSLIKNNGLGLKQKFPPLIDQAIEYGKALFKYKVAGSPNVDNNEQLKRLNLCYQCEFLYEHRCTKCGCPVTEKTLWATESCPINKWNETQQLKIENKSNNCGC